MLGTPPPNHLIGSILISLNYFMGKTVCYWLTVTAYRLTEHTIATLRKWFAQFDLPCQFLSDNGSQFTSETFNGFMEK